MAKRARPGRTQAGPTDPPRSGTPVEEAALVAELLAAPTLGVTRAGLPRREPQAHLVPGAFSGEDDPAPAQRSAEGVRDRLQDYTDGVRRARQGS